MPSGVLKDLERTAVMLRLAHACHATVAAYNLAPDARTAGSHSFDCFAT